LNPITPASEAWDAFVEARGGHILQSDAWGRLKSAFGWAYERVALVDSDGEIVCGALVLYRRFPPMAYVPRGPIVDWSDDGQAWALLAELAQRARQRGAILLKLEPDIADTPDYRDRFAKRGLHHSSHLIQPPRTILLNIADNDDSILARMNQGTRRKIRLSERREVTIRLGETDDVDSFNTLMQRTGERNEFGVHAPAYYRTTYDLFVLQGRAALLMASYGGSDLAGLMVFTLGKRAWYFYGASSGEESNRMPTYGLQWAAIQWARERGCTEYDLWGIPDDDPDTLEAQFQERTDGLWGVYGFKRGFGGEISRSVGAWDYVLNPFLYRLYRLAVRIWL
jgi:lipid II:glycine glycyltransferase (peptidoglycan interpeptide bridge formation enzyme)